ncbi:MAG: hypothetical protein PPHEINF_4781, partial [uncultured Paraburkholderia sp.]
MYRQLTPGQFADGADAAEWIKRNYHWGWDCRKTTWSGLNKAEDLARRGFAVGFALWKLQ